MIAELLDKGARLQPDSLEAVLRHGDPKYVRAVLDMGADARQSLHRREYPLIFEAQISGGNAQGQANAVEIARLLVARGADVNTIQGEWSVLNAACHAGNLELLRFLFAQGVRFRKEEQRAAFKFALGARKSDVVRFLAARGVDINVRDAQGKTALVLLRTEERNYYSKAHLEGTRRMIATLKSLGAHE